MGFVSPVSPFIRQSVSVSPFAVSARQQADRKAAKDTRRTDAEGHPYHVPPHQKEASTTRERKSKKELAASGAELFSEAGGGLLPNSTAAQANLTTDNATTLPGTATGGAAPALLAKAWAEARAHGEGHTEEGQGGLLQVQPRNRKLVGGL